MHDSKLGVQTWLLGLFLIVSNPKGRSSVQLAADLGITQKSAWHETLAWPRRSLTTLG